MTIYTPPPGGAVDLVFRRRLDTTHPVDLVFGDESAGAAVNAVGELVAPMPSLLTVLGVGIYDNAVSRGLRAVTSSGWVPGQAQRREAAAPWIQAERVRGQAVDRWTQATPQRPEVRAGWVHLGRVRADRSAGWQLGAPLRLDAATAWQVMARQRAVLSAVHQVGAPVSAQAQVPWQVMGRRRGALLAVHQVAAPRRRDWRAPHAPALRLGRGLGLPWGLARRPGAGMLDDGGTVTPPPVLRCYTPPRGDQVEIALAERWYGPSAVLRFRCRIVDLPATYTVPYRKVYMAVHSVAAVRLPDLLPITLDDVTISADVDGFGWSLSGTGPAALMSQLGATGGVPAQVRITVDGIPWVFVIDKVGRTRRFGQWRAQVKGLSATALLGAPWSASRTWTNAAARTAVQLLEDCVTGTDFQVDASAVDDWLVPAGAWSFSGTPLAAVQRIAESIGAVLVSDRVAPVLRLLPRYPVMPWEWSASTVAPDVRLPLASVESDGWERRDAPAWSRAIVAGEAQGVLGIITRAGTGGTLAAPLVTDALATAQAMVLQRGRAILGAGGPQALITQTLPVLTGAGLPGVLQLGQLVETIEPDETWRGLVRGVSLKAGFPAIRQTVTLERHLQEA